jgi:hypothetical protein
MLKNAKFWTCITAFLAAWVYIDIFLFLGAFFITIPITVLSAIISIIISTKHKHPIFVLLNLLFAVIAVISIIIIPW